jgi:hypothetical protein
VKAALFMFNCTPAMPQPWADAGYECWCIDLQNARGERREGNIVWVGADALAWLPPRREWVFAAFFPPCTDVAVSGARWFRDKGLGAVIQALTLFKRSVDLGELLGCPYMIENPVSTVATYWREPDHVFHPYDFTAFELSDNYTKKTCLWAGNGFVMPKPNQAADLPEPDNKRIWYGGSSIDDRANFRSATPAGFARAVFEANRPDRQQIAVAA